MLSVFEAKNVFLYHYISHLTQSPLTTYSDLSFLEITELLETHNFKKLSFDLEAN